MQGGGEGGRAPILNIKGRPPQSTEEVGTSHVNSKNADVAPLTLYIYNFFFFFSSGQPHTK